MRPNYILLAEIICKQRLNYYWPLLGEGIPAKFATVRAAKRDISGCALRSRQAMACSNHQMIILMMIQNMNY